MTNNRNPYELRMDIISMAVRIERERFQTEKNPPRDPLIRQNTIKKCLPHQQVEWQSQD